jgi:hypothetical protein
MSVRGLVIVANVLALMGLVACGGESPLSTAADEPAAVKDSSNVTSLAVATQTAQETKVTICHVPPGNPENAHEITVAESSLKAHFPHGDTIGTCAGEPPPPVECMGDCSTLDQTCCVARIDCEWIWDEFENGTCEVVSE